MRIRVLHVDDEPDILDVVAMSLDLDPALSTRNCASGSDALQIAVNWTPNIILLDVMMPLMDGMTTLVHLRENSLTAGIPVVFITVRVKIRDVDRYRALGASGVIPKPFDPMTLASVVRGYIEPPEDRGIAMRPRFPAESRPTFLAATMLQAGSERRSR